MPSADKIIIFTGDTFKVTYESLQPGTADVYDPNNYGFEKVPALPDSAFAQVWDITSQAYLELGGVGIDQAEADVDQHKVSFTLDEAFTQNSGSYKIYITAVYPDGQKVTEMRAFKVSPRS